MQFSAGSEGKKEASLLCNAVSDVCERLERHGLMSGPLAAELKEVRYRLSVFLCPFPIAELDRQVKERDEKFPEWDNGYTLAGRAVIWHTRRKSPPP